jgi:hypothetical protein
MFRISGDRANSNGFEGEKRIVDGFSLCGWYFAMLLIDATFAVRFGEVII